MSVGNQLRRSVLRDLYAETEGDYSQAIEYYKVLKENFIKNITQRTIEEQTKTLKEIEQNFLSNINASYQNTEETEEGNNIENVAWNEFLKAVDLLGQLYEASQENAISDEMRAKFLDYQTKYYNISKQYKAKNNKKLKAEQTKIANSMRRYITNQAQLEFANLLDSMFATGQMPSDLKGAENLIISLAKRRYFAKQMGSIVEDKENIGRNTDIFYRITQGNAESGYRNALLGSLIQEKRVSSAMMDYFGDRIIPSGTLKRVSQYERKGKLVTSSVQIGSDILIFDKLLDETTKEELEKIKSIFGSGEIVLGKDWDNQRLQEDNEEKELLISGLKKDMSALANNLDYIYGVNIKKWALSKASQRRTDMYIGYSLGYKNIGYKYDDKNRKDTYVNNLLAGARSAIHVLGVRNVFMAQGSGVSFMDDFIKEFRREQLFIQAETQGAYYDNYFKAIGSSSAIELNYNKWMQCHNVINKILSPDTSKNKKSKKKK